jgi:hypothetical protein
MMQTRGGQRSAARSCNDNDTFDPLPAGLWSLECPNGLALRTPLQICELAPARSQPICTSHGQTR